MSDSKSNQTQICPTQQFDFDPSDYELLNGVKNDKVLQSFEPSGIATRGKSVFIASDKSPKLLQYDRRSLSLENSVRYESISNANPVVKIESLIRFQNNIILVPAFIKSDEDALAIFDMNEPQNEGQPLQTSVMLSDSEKPVSLAKALATLFGTEDIKIEGSTICDNQIIIAARMLDGKPSTKMLAFNFEMNTDESQLNLTFDHQFELLTDDTSQQFAISDIYYDKTKHEFYILTSYEMEYDPHLRSRLYVVKKSSFGQVHSSTKEFIGKAEAVTITRDRRIIITFDNDRQSVDCESAETHPIPEHTGFFISQPLRSL